MNAKFLVVFSCMFVPTMADLPELHKAVVSLDIGKLEKMVSKNVDGSVREPKQLQTALHYMAYIPREKLDSVEPKMLPGTLKRATDLLLRAGATVDLFDYRERTAVHTAVSKNAFELWLVFYDKMLVEIAGGEWNGPWTKCLDVGSPKSVISLQKPTPLALACYSYPRDRKRTREETLNHLIRLQASRFGDDFEMNEKMTVSLVVLYMGPGHNEKEFLMDAAIKHKVDDFKTFFQMFFDEFKRFNGLENPKMDGIAAALLAYEEKNVYPFYLWVRDYFVRYKCMYMLRAYAFIADCNFHRVRRLTRTIRSEGVLDFERELFRDKAEISKEIRQLGRIIGKTIYLDEDAVIFCIIQYETGAKLEDIKNVLKNWPGLVSPDSNPEGSSDSSSSPPELRKYLDFNVLSTTE